jgi:hypothetical protein
MLLLAFGGHGQRSRHQADIPAAAADVRFRGNIGSSFKFEARVNFKFDAKMSSLEFAHEFARKNTSDPVPPASQCRRTLT